MHQEDLFSYKEKYPNTPGHRGVDTSVAAADSMKSTSGRLQKLVLDRLAQLPGGVTPDEMAELLGVSMLSIRPRFTELKILGRIIDTGARRKNASGRNSIVWRIA